jgi:hypothetical protein
VGGVELIEWTADDAKETVDEEQARSAEPSRTASRRGKGGRTEGAAEMLLSVGRDITD